MRWQRGGGGELVGGSDGGGPDGGMGGAGGGGAAEGGAAPDLCGGVFNFTTVATVDTLPTCWEFLERGMDDN